MSLDDLIAAQDARIAAAKAAGWTVEPYTRWRALDRWHDCRFEGDDFDTDEAAWDFAADQHERDTEDGTP